jgi:hypothetical protein
MSTFGNSLIEHLRTRLVDVQPQKKLTERSIALAKNLNIDRKAKTGRTDEQIVPVHLLCQAVMAVSNHSFDRQRLIERVGRIVEDQDGVAGVDWSRSYARMAK